MLKHGSPMMALKFCQTITTLVRIIIHSSEWCIHFVVIESCSTECRFPWKPLPMESIQDWQDVTPFTLHFSHIHICLVAHSDCSPSSSSLTRTRIYISMNWSLTVEHLRFKHYSMPFQNQRPFHLRSINPNVCNRFLLCSGEPVLRIIGVRRVCD